jgi:CubicO group peptidase (beta-lactamase class C family)
MKDVGKAIRLGLCKRRIFTRMVKEDQPGAAVMVVAAGRVVHQRAYGLADVENHLPVTRQTAFNLASVSKQFTAMAVLLLAERGRLAFEDDVRTYLPELPRYHKTRLITLRDLLCHTSGIPDYSSVWRGASRETTLTNAQFLKRLVKHPLDFRTGTRADYSNSNYILLALVIERVSRKPFRRFMKEELFQPLGMKHSYIHDDLGLHIPHRAKGYNMTHAGEVEKSDIPIVLVGHSHMFTTITDLAFWANALQGHRLVQPRTLAQAFKAGRLDSGKKHIYGFGWYRESKRGRRVFGHSGSWYGFSSYICRYLKDNLTVAVLSNNESLDVERLAGQLAELYLQIGTISS